MPDIKSQRINSCLLKIIGSTEDDIGATATTVVSSVGETLNVPAVTIREAIWRLVDAQEIEFTEGRRLRVKSGGQAA